MSIDPALLRDNVLTKMKPEDRKALGKVGRTVAEVSADVEAKVEREIHAQIMQTLRRLQVSFLHAPMNKRSTLPEGWEDFTIFIPIREPSPYSVPIPASVWFVEVKAATGKLSPAQEKTIAMHRQQGFRVSVPRSYQEFADELNRLITPIK